MTSLELSWTNWRSLGLSLVDLQVILVARVGLKCNLGNLGGQVGSSEDHLEGFAGDLGGLERHLGASEGYSRRSSGPS